jgi:D-alanyl-D-alanine carboxypeptidase
MSRLDRELHRIVDHEHAKPNTQAVLLGVQSRDGRIHFRGGAGRADPNARFCIASVSKMFTATVIMQLVDEQRLNLDTTAQTYLPHIDLTCISLTAWRKGAR